MAPEWGSACARRDGGALAVETGDGLFFIMLTKETIEANLSGIQQRIREAAERAGRGPEEVRLVAVTKSVDSSAVRALCELGVTHIGENRVQVAEEKVRALSDAPICWHMVGHIQRRKAKDVLALFDKVDSVDRMRLARELQKRCEESERQADILAEVNVSGEEAKHGFAPAALKDTLAELAGLDRLNVRGLMTMAPFGAEESVLRQVFGTLRRLAHDHGLPEVSMGMTDDFEVAIEEGATEVRIGRALFV
mgnify:CR=1 FL=1